MFMLQRSHRACNTSNIFSRFRFVKAKFSSSSPNKYSRKKRVVFLGTPAVAVATLSQLLEASRMEDSLFDIVAVVSKQAETASSKHHHHHRDAAPAMRKMCELYSLPQYTPYKASDPEFLKQMSALDPDLFITAAYGLFLPPSFLKLARYGTLNLHPSLLPLYRGAAPVQRSLERGDETVGVSVLYTIRKMDAGPIVAQKKIQLEGHEKSTEVLSTLFHLGTSALLSSLPQVFRPDNILVDGHQGQSGGSFSSVQAAHLALLPHVTTQESTGVTHSEAPKVSAEEAEVKFASMTARDIHNRCRGFSEWPGVWAHFYLRPPDAQQLEGGVCSTKHKLRESNDHALIKIKLITTSILERPSENGNVSNEASYHVLNGPDGSGNGDKKSSKSKHAGLFRVVCGDGSVLGVHELQPAGKKIMAAKNFFNGLRGRALMYKCS